MAITRDTYNRGVLVPKLPDYSMTQPNYKPQTNTDPSSYYTNALGFLPVDTRYLSNTTNSLAYNSMADVLFNRQAHKERWEDSGWDWLVDTPIVGDIVRIPVDTALLFKDTVINPIVQGVIDDGWSGLLRGLSTATMNSLINLGNTLDIVSNPIKGLVLEGSEGFVKGLVGDENGRKQYDYADYIDTGSGFIDTIASLALEIVSDPLNWVSFGGKQLISSGAKTLSSAATDGITKALDMAITAGKNSVDDVAEALVKNTKYFDNTTAKAFANQMVDGGTGVITKASADTVVNNFSDNLTKTIKRLGTSGDLSENGINSLAGQLLQGKSTRAKASLFNRTPFSVEDQSVVGRYLQDLDVSKLPSKYMTGVKTYKGVQNVERGLRWLGGTGFYPVIGTNELRKHISKRINNVRAAKDIDCVIKHVQDFDADLRFDYSGKIIEDTKTTLGTDVTEVNDALQTIKDDYMDKLLSYKTYSLRSKTIQNLQGRTLDKINKKLSNLLAAKGITDLDGYINYLKNADVASDVLEPFNALRRMLTTDVSDPTVLRQYRAGIIQFQQLQDYHINFAKKNGLVKLAGQQDSMDLNASRMAKYREAQQSLNDKASAIDEIINPYSRQLDDALNKILETRYVETLSRPKDWGAGSPARFAIKNKKGKYVPLQAWPKDWKSGKYYAVDTRRNLIDSLETDIVPNVREMLLTQKHSVKALDEILDTFKEALRKFDEAPADLEVRSALVQAYQSLDGYLKGLAKFPEYNINTATEVINKLGAHPLTRVSVNKTGLERTGYGDLGASRMADKIKKVLDADQHYVEIKTVLDSLDPTDELYTIIKSQLDERFDDLMSSKLGLDSTQAKTILKQAAVSKPNAVIINETTRLNTSITPEVVTNMIKDLPSFNIKTLDKLIDPADYNTYKLVTYSIMTRKAHFLNDMLGLDFDGTLLNNFDELVQELTVLKNSLGDITPEAFIKLPEVQQIMSRLTEASTEQPLAVMLMEYSNKSSKLYQILNNEKYVSDVATKGYTTVLQDTKALLERLQSYKRLTQQLSELTKKWGDVYQSAYVDAFVTALGQGKRLTHFTEEVVDDMMNSADLFVRNTCDVETTAMDSLLSKTATELVNKNISEETTQLASEILETLQSGLAHGAVTDVDNWVRLMHLSKHTSDTRINGVFDALLQKAKGRNTVVFDIESTGAKEATSVPFQISGKVLDANGNIISGSEFNFIMKPPKGVEPLPSVLEKLAQGSNPKQWWLDNIVNASSDVVYDNAQEGIAAFIKHCNKFSDSGFILAGQNIKNFDITMLRNCASDTDKAFFKNINLSEDVFDSLDYFDLNSFFKIQGDSRIIFKAELMDMFKAAIEAQESALGIKPFTYADMETLSNFKKAYSEVEFSTEVAKKPRVSHYSEDIVIPKAADETLYELEDIFNIEGIITDIKNAWRKPSSYKGKAYFTVTKLNPDSVEQIIKTRLADLSNKGLIDVAPGRNIMQLFNTGVDARHIIINPKRAISYEIEDFFDMDKLLKSGFSPDQKRLLFKDMCRFTQATSKIKNIRTWLTQDVVDYLKEDARKLLKEAANSNEFEINLAKGFYDELDDVSTVAAAVYLYNRAPKDSILKKTFGVTEVFEKAGAEPVLKKGAATTRTDFDLFGDIAEVRRRIKSADAEYTPTKLQHMSDIDTITEQPRFIYEDDVYGPNYVDIVKAYEGNVLNKITAFNVDKNIYNINTAAVRALRADHLDFAQRVEAYLSRRPNIRTKVEAAIRSHNNALDDAAIKQILARPNRVQALCDESYARMGRVYFETKNKVDLSDFEASKNCIVLANKETPHGTYAQIICIKKDISLKNTDVVLDTRVIKNVDGIDAEGLKLIYECRQRMGAYSKNIGYSHGDLATANTVEVFDDMLYSFGFTKEQIAQLPDINELTSAGFFKSLNANNSIIGGKKTWEFITNDPNVHYISDPFKQLFYNTRSAVTTHNTKLMSYLNLIYSEHNNIKTSSLFKDLKPEDKVKLLKNNPDFGVYYITRSRGKWDKTKSGLVMKEVQIINANSIKLAEGLEAHILPRVQAAQAMKAINDFELPPIAQFAKDVSDVFKVAYLGSVGFLIRNFIDSNYKTYASLNGEVSLPKQLKHFFSTMGLVRKHTNIGQEYTARLGKYFNSDFDYKIFYEYCQHIDDSDVVAKIISKFDERYSVKITRRVKELIERFPREAVVKVQKDLIEPDLFSVIDVFIRTGPSAGLTKTITNNIPSTVKDGGVLRSFNTFMTERTPLRFVFNTNETIEQSARLSLFLQDLERGSNIDSAIKNVIKTHFDYSDKSLGMLYTEIVFPFMSFSYKNLDYWLETIYKNPLLVGQLENVLRPVLNYNSIFNPNQEAYRDFDYTFDWSKDIASFEARAPWTMINAARLYHILNGNIVIDTGKDVEHDAGYGSKTNDLYTVFKLSPSVLDAVKTLYNPLDSMSERLLPPFEALQNVMLNMLDDKATTDDLNITTLTNMLPYVDVITQRVGIDQSGLKHNNIFQRIEDAGPLMGMASVFGAVYVPQKDANYWYDSDYNILGGFKQNYYGKRNYSNPYSTRNPRYTITRMSQNRKPKSTYTPSIKKRLYDYQYSGIQRNLVNRVLVPRIKDYKYYY